MEKSKNDLNSSSRKKRSDLVAHWRVVLPDGIYNIEFEHGTTSGKRVLIVNGKEIVRRDWMFRLVGEEVFEIGKQRTKCILSVEPLPFFTFGYGLKVDGKDFEKFTEKQNKSLQTWVLSKNDNRQYRIVLEKHTLNVWINGDIKDTESLFVDDGTEIRFKLDQTHQGAIKSKSATKKGITYELFVDGDLVPHENQN